jgi:hypothetical protein
MVSRQLLVHRSGHRVRRWVHIHVADAHWSGTLWHGAGHHDVARKRARRVRVVQAAGSCGGRQVLLLLSIILHIIERRMLAHGRRRITSHSDTAIQLARLMDHRVSLRK